MKNASSPASYQSPILQCLHEKRLEIPPIWLMRQAGRHLPEYQVLRKKAGDFSVLCNTPELAAEASLQPVQRYDLDAAIVFSDILFILEALDCTVRFEDGLGPVIGPVPDFRKQQDLPVSEISRILAPIFQTVSIVRSRLKPDKAVIGFAGAPFTLAVYALSGTNNPGPALKALYQEPEAFIRFLNRLAEAVAISLAGQARAGADIVMLFDSWAGGLDPQTFSTVISQPNALVRTRLQDLQITAPLIGFPRGGGIMLPAYAQETGVDCLGLDTSMDMAWADKNLPKNLAVQGNLDPLRLLHGGKAMEEGIDRILHAVSDDRPLIFNLGHGVHPDTPVSHVMRLVERIRNG